MIGLRACLVVPFALLAACGGGGGGDGSINNHGHGYAYDAQAASGVRVRWDGGAQWPSLAYIDEVWQITSSCVGEVAPGPLVIFADVPDDGAAVNVTGRAYLDTGTVVIELRDSLIATTTDLRHEFVHWLLHYGGRINMDQQRAHDAPEFIACAAPTADMPPVGTPIAAP